MVDRRLKNKRSRERERERERESEKGSCFRVALYLARILWMRDCLSREEEEDDEEEDETRTRTRTFHLQRKRGKWAIV
jgi:hypothetical protein